MRNEGKKKEKKITFLVPYNYQNIRFLYFFF